MTESLRVIPNQEPMGALWSSVMKYGLAIAVLIFYFTVILHFNYTPDSTYMYLQYAKNLAHGDGFSFNAGTPSYGITAPLWVLLIAAGAKLGLDPFIVAKTFDILFACFSIILVQILAFHIIKDKIYAFFAAWMFSFDAWLIRWSGSGMDTSLAVLLTLLSVWYAFHREYYLSACAAGLLTLVRPEAVLLFAIIEIDQFLEARRLNLSYRYFAWSLAIFAVLVGPWTVFSFLQFGTVLPNTLGAKSAAGIHLADFVRTIGATAKILLSTQFLTLTMLVVSFVILLGQAGLSPVWEVAFPVTWVVLLPLVYAVQSVHMISRYLLPVTPILIIYAVWGMKRLEETWGVSYRRMLKVLCALAGFALLQNVYVYRSQIVPEVVNVSVGMNNCVKPIAFWLRNNSPDHTTVVAEDVGLLGYISEKQMYDPAGVVNPAMRASFAGISYDQAMQQHRYAGVVRPDYIVDRSTVMERLLSDSLRPILTAEYPGPSLLKTGRVYLTLYRVVK
ncbi:MAG: hypothetical protein WBD36_13585 [Bacteroidota bacterium]